MPSSLTYAYAGSPGIRRLGGPPPKKFRYVVEATGERPSVDDELRIKALAIPPAWTNVWISLDPNGHIQATGIDAKGRKQYRYHTVFRSKRDQNKFAGLVPFAYGLGSLRRQVESDLTGIDLSHDRVVAAVVRLLDMTLLRVGNERYTKANRSYGLCTLRNKHVEIKSRAIDLSFVGKSGHKFSVHVDSPRLARIVRRCHDLPGQQLFQYVDGDGEVRPVSSADINSYIREHTGAEATAKTFRTWGATVLAAELLAAEETPTSDAQGARLVNAAIDQVAARLGNTRTVCRNSYVHPAVIASYLAGTLNAKYVPSRRAPQGLTGSEKRLLALLDPAAKQRPARPKAAPAAVTAAPSAASAA
jgi:DNA topoisomerase-1